MILKAGLTEETSEEKDNARHEMDRDGTVDLVIDLVLEHFPTATEDDTNFLIHNKKYIESLLGKSNIEAELAKNIPQVCPRCNGAVVKWKHKTKNSFLVSLGEIQNVVIPVNQCRKCFILLYPQLYNVGLIPLHNKEVIRF